MLVQTSYPSADALSAPNPAPPLPGPAAVTPDQLLAYLAGLGIATVTHHHPPLFTVADSKALRGTLPGGHCKNLLLKDRKGALWLVVAQEDLVLDLNRLHHKLGSVRLSFAGSDMLGQVLGVRPGSVTPFGLINDRERRVAVVIDRALTGVDPLNFHPLVNDRTTAIAPAGLFAFIESCGHAVRLVDL